jgi:succinoglycan biosynthesis transport protein ExoP
MAPVLAAPAARIDSNSDESKAMTADRKNAAPVQDWLRYAVDSPSFGKVIGVTSTLPNEGKSTISANLAHLIADAGGSVILVDADLRSPSLSRKYSPDALGSIGAVMSNIALNDAIVSIPFSTMHFLPAGATARLPHTNEILASTAFKKIIDELRAKYD